MAIIDSDSTGLYLLIVLIVTSISLLGKFLYYNLEYFYSIKRMIFFVVKYLAEEAYGKGPDVQLQAAAAGVPGASADSTCSCVQTGNPGQSQDAILTPKMSDLTTLITQDFDTYIINLAKYIENNVDSNRRLDVLNQESGRFIDFNNYLEVIKFFILLAAVIGLTVTIIQAKYNKWLSPFSLITNR